jgi:hypothetical protein
MDSEDVGPMRPDASLPAFEHLQRPNLKADEMESLAFLGLINDPRINPPHRGVGIVV